MYANRMNNDMAVSPIVATLVLIVVAVIGAVAVGTIMGTFSTDVSKQASAGEARTSSQTELIIAGSTTMDPVTQALGKIYSQKNPGIKVSSQSTGSGAGFQAVTLGVADLGAMSENLNDARKAQNPNAQTHRIGSGAIVLITNATNQAHTAALPYSEIKALFTAGTVGATMQAGTIAIVRSDSSGTADSFYNNFLGTSTLKTVAGSSVTGNGNADLVTKVAQSTVPAIGFCDFGYVANRKDVTIIPYIDEVNAAAYSKFDYATLAKAAQSEYRINVEKSTTDTQAKVSSYNLTLIHPLNYISNGEPSVIANGFMNFATGTEATQAFKDTNTFGLAQLL